MGLQIPDPAERSFPILLQLGGYVASQRIGKRIEEAFGAC